jgi:hypothetical protein
MSNRDAPSGFKVAMHMSGGIPGRLTEYNIVAALAKNIYTGDVVIPVNTTKRITRPTAGTERPQGVFDGCFYALADGTPRFERYWPSGQVVQTGSQPVCSIYDDPNTVFEVQVDGTFSLAYIGGFTDYTVGTGNNLTGQSGDEVVAGESGATCKILDYVRRPDNEIGANTKVLVSFAIHYMRGAQTAI